MHILSRLRCEFVVEFHAMFQDDNTVYLLTEFIPGGELFSHLRKSEKFSPEVAKFYAIEIASAIRCLHHLNIAYRDIKPENILLTKDGHIKLVDFGFAKIVTTSTFTLCGYVG